MNGNLNLDMMLTNLKQRFDSALYSITQPGLSAGKKIAQLAPVKQQVTAILSEAVQAKKMATSQDEVQKIDAFIGDCNRIYSDAVNYVTNDIVEDPSVDEYKAEAMKEQGGATIIPPSILTGGGKDAFMQHNMQAAQKIAPIAPAPAQYATGLSTAPAIPAITTEQLMNLSVLNVSSDIDMRDGEPMLSGNSSNELFYVISPYTENNRIVVTRFINPDEVSKYVYNNFKNDNVRPVIIFGKPATIQFSVSLAF